MTKENVFVATVLSKKNVIEDVGSGIDEPEEAIARGYYARELIHYITQNNLSLIELMNLYARMDCDWYLRHLSPMLWKHILGKITLADLSAEQWFELFRLECRGKISDLLELMYKAGPSITKEALMTFVESHRKSEDAYERFLVDNYDLTLEDMLAIDKHRRLIHGRDSTRGVNWEYWMNQYKGEHKEKVWYKAAEKSGVDLIVQVVRQNKLSKDSVYALVEKFVINKRRSFRLYLWGEILKTNVLYQFQVYELCKKAELHFGTEITTCEVKRGGFGKTGTEQVTEYPIGYKMWKAAKAAGYTINKKQRERINKIFRREVFA